MDNLRIPDHRITVVNRGRLDPEPQLTPDARRSVRAELGIPEGAILVVNVGRHEHQKDHPTLLAALAPLLARQEDLWLAVAGREGSETPAIRKALEGMPDVARVLLLGHRGDVPSVLAAADIFVMTSRYEGLPGAIIEAMSVGLPVVASDIGPVREVVEPEVSALLARPGDPTSFRVEIEKLIEDPALRDLLGRRGRELFESRFTIGASAEGMARLYRQVLSRR